MCLGFAGRYADEEIMLWLDRDMVQTELGLTIIGAVRGQVKFETRSHAMAPYISLQWQCSRDGTAPGPGREAEMQDVPYVAVILEVWARPQLQPATSASPDRPIAGVDEPQCRCCAAAVWAPGALRCMHGAISTDVGKLLLLGFRQHWCGMCCPQPFPIQHSRAKNVSQTGRRCQLSLLLSLLPSVKVKGCCLMR